MCTLIYHTCLHVKVLCLCVTDDDTFLDNEDDLKKHLINEVGTIWRGTARQPHPLLWEYGQVSNAHPRLQAYHMHDMLKFCSIVFV